jgi:Fe2+ transport system protein FeoA
VASLATRDPERLQKLMAFGILPGMPIVLLQRSPAFVFQIGQTQVAVDERIAADIVVASGSRG